MPLWVAVIVQLPAAMSEAVVPDTVQMLVVEELKVTGKPELAEAISVIGVPTVWLPIVGNEMVCGLPPPPPPVSPPLTSYE